MIRILKHGHKPIVAHCPECECEFAFHISDMKSYGNKIDQFESINCPECGYKLEWWFGEKSGRKDFHFEKKE